MDDHYYNKLKTLVDDGRLSVFIVIAPPRSNSSVIEHVLSLSPDIHNACHEPFLGARKEDFEADAGYRQIYESIGGEVFENSNDQTSVVVKEMAHWIGSNNEYKNLISLTHRPVVLLIRNPLLTVESRIRRVLKTLDMRPGLSLQQSLLDDLARDNGFQNGVDFLSSSEADIQLILQKIQLDIPGIKDLYHAPVLSVQNNLLDYYARKSGYVNWRDLLDQKLYKGREYRFFESILKVNTNRANFEENEFKKLDEIMRYLKVSEQPYVVFDTTDIRAEPNHQLRELCLKLGISFSPEMINWDEKPVDFYTQQHEEYEKIWYEKLFLSSELNFPNEVPPTLEMFPDFVQKYLREFNLPIYADLSKEKNLSSEIKREINNRKFKVHVSEENQGLLRSLGVIQDGVIGVDTLVELCDIDPVYAVTNDPSLAENEEFRSRKQRYANEIAIISDALKETDEPSRESSSHLKFR